MTSQLPINMIANTITQTSPTLRRDLCTLLDFFLYQVQDDEGIYGNWGKGTMETYEAVTKSFADPDAIDRLARLRDGLRT